MTGVSLCIRYGAPAVIAVMGVLVWRSVDAQDGGPKFVVCRHRLADGRDARRVDLAAVERLYRGVARETADALTGLARHVAPREVTRIAHDTRLKSCFGARERVVTLAERVPEKFRNLDLWFVTVPRGGTRPRALPDTLPAGAEILVLRADSLEDVARLARSLDRRVSFATAEFARAVGVECADAHVTFTSDGRAAVVREVRP